MTKITPTLVRELHGRSVKARLARCLEQVHAARNGDVVAVRQVGLLENGAPFTNASTFLVKTDGGLEEYRLCDLPCSMSDDAAVAIGALDDDWELLGDLADAAPMAFDEDPSCRWFEMIKFRDAIVLLRLPRLCGMYEGLAPYGRDEMPAFLFIERDADGMASTASSHETRALIDLSSWILDRRLPGLLTNCADA